MRARPNLSNQAAFIALAAYAVVASFSCVILIGRIRSDAPPKETSPESIRRWVDKAAVDALKSGMVVMKSDTGYSCVRPQRPETSIIISYFDHGVFVILRFAHGIEQVTGILDQEDRLALQFFGYLTGTSDNQVIDFCRRSIASPQMARYGEFGRWRFDATEKVPGSHLVATWDF